MVKIRIHGTDGHIQLRVTGQDMIGRRSLCNQRRNDLILFAKLTFGHVNPCSGIMKFSRYFLSANLAL